MFVVKWGDAWVDMGRTRSDVLGAVGLVTYNGSRGYTGREALNIALILSDDFPVSD